MRLSTRKDDISVTLLLLLGLLVHESRCLEVIYAINAGGEAHTDSYGIRYARDPLLGKVGTASDYGKQLIIGRVNNIDQILYQTERYHYNTFGYDIPINQDGDYVMILKFCEVYFNSPNMKVNFCFTGANVKLSVLSPSVYFYLSNLQLATMHRSSMLC